MKTGEGRNALKEKTAALNSKLTELSNEKLGQVSGGADAAASLLITDSEAKAVEKMTTVIQEKYEKWQKTEIRNNGFKEDLS